MSEQKCITSVCATILKLLGTDMPQGTDTPNEEITALAGCETVDRVVIFNPDAIGWWLFEKYGKLFGDAQSVSAKTVRLRSVMPSVTPVCFASMYSGLMPTEHGIQKYEKPVLKVDTVFDYLPRTGKKCAIVSTAGDSISKIFLERDIDYFIYPTIGKVNRKAEKLIKDSDYDLIVIYNGNYDTTMHKAGPEGRKSIRALKENLAAYCRFVSLIKKYHPDERVFYGFCPDHGCHEIDRGRGSHGIDMEEDMNVVHIYGITERK